MRTDTQRGAITDGRASYGSSPAALASQAAHPVENPGKLIKLGCALCTESFILDVEEYWLTPPEEMEILGREFLNVHRDAVLCPHCLHEVEQTGAERIYWSLADC